MKRILWLDVAKGLAMLAVVYFHFFRTYFEHGVLPPADWSNTAAGTLTFLREAWLFLSGLGFHAVGAFLILSGWALTQSTARRAEAGPVQWGAWYRSRLLRLYPMYWFAHFVYLISPFTARFEPIDDRIVPSLLGLRFVDIQMNFFYLNAAWWYFSMLIQLYLLFPLLFRLAQRIGPLAFFLVAAGIGFFVRYLLLIPYPSDGDWILGGLALCRLPEFAFGMALGLWFHRAPARMERILIGGLGLLGGVVLYPAALKLYHNGLTYVFVDFATGLCFFLVIVGLAGILARLPFVGKTLGLVGAFSYGIYLVHQPYVIWLGLRIREVPLWGFLLIVIATLTVMSVWGILLEKAANAFVGRYRAAGAPARG
ncbi:MAG: acyltransferase [Verrucomicrobiota bacterium]|nr:acyltransferase [Verrucomicrobiota bacterium]